MGGRSMQSSGRPNRVDRCAGEPRLAHRRIAPARATVACFRRTIRDSIASAQPPAQAPAHGDRAAPPQRCRGAATRTAERRAGKTSYPRAAVAAPEPLSVDDALDRLVNQFSDSMAFLRELIQNALDAGSEEVEVWFERRDGRMIIHVDDWGEGMNREIIETRLTRLFSSSQAGDRTTIGQFGIGFVSVSAIEPEAVCIDTSRDGEHWRILFDAQRKFSLIRRDEPVEGTKLQIFKLATVAEYEQFRRRAGEVV